MPAPAPVVIVSQPCPPPPPSGYWQTIQSRVWVPARWIYTVDECGRRTRVYQQGYYTMQTERVWVETTEVCRDDRSNYRRDRRDDWRH